MAAKDINDQPLRASNETSEGLTFPPELQARWEATRERRTLSLKLVDMRLAAGLTQKELADRMGKDQAFVSRMEMATTPFPKAQNIALYARHCGRYFAYAFLTPEEDDGLTLSGLAPLEQDAEPGKAIAGMEEIALPPAASGR